MTAAVEKYDFNRPQSLPDHSTDQLSVWMKAFCSQLKERWASISSVDRDFQISRPIIQTLSKARDSIAPTSVAFRLQMGEKPFDSILLMDQQVTLAYHLNLVGQEPEELPEGRSLTEIEWSLSQYWFENVADRLGQAWPQQDPLKVELCEPIEAPHRTRLLPPDEQVMVYSFECEAPFGKHQLMWIAPQEEIETLLTQLNGSRVSLDEQTTEKMETLATQMQMNVKVHIGNRDVTFSELASLQVGDCLVLDKKVTETVDVSIEDEIKFRGWLCRNGNKQVVQIESVM